MEIYSVTDAGKVRTSNQDAYAYGHLEHGAVWAVVCDGMGGAKGGDIASTTAVGVIANVISHGYRGDMTGNSVRNLISAAISAANISVYDASKLDDALSGMGTTVVVAVVCEDTVYIGYAGDSRAYTIRAGAASQITVDHSVVQAMVQRGQITEAEARVHPRRNLITRALGVNETVDIDFCECQLEPDDILLVCTDGLSNFVKDEQIALLSSQGERETLAARLVECANENGGGDNITALVISK